MKRKIQCAPLLYHIVPCKVERGKKSMKIRQEIYSMFKYIYKKNTKLTTTTQHKIALNMFSSQLLTVELGIIRTSVSCGKFLKQEII